MDSETFVMLLRALHNIDGYCLESDFDEETQARFCRDPVRFLMAADEAQRGIVWHEVLKRHARNLELRGSR